MILAPSEQWENIRTWNGKESTWDTFVKSNERNESLKARKNCEIDFVSLGLN